MGGFGWKEPLLCNGANLGFEKDAFEQVGGYTGNEDIASGDDLFLMEKIEDRFGGGVQFIKDRGAVVTTLGVTSWKDLLQQRIRWAAKTARQQNIFNKILGGIVLLTNAALVLLLIHSILTYGRLSPVLLGLLAFKLVIDVVYILPALRFFGSKLPLIYLLPVGLLYPLISCWTGIRSLCGGYRWKGRNHKR
jgi:cellulose synthase/poly-beta-1,6-N-acetylglucosamine synthase-like glycosyltransferase